MYYDIGAAEEKQPTCTVRRWRNGYVGSMHIPTARGEIKLVAFTPMGPIRKAVMTELQNRPGWGWSSITKAVKGVAKKIARARVIRKVAGAYKDILKNPMLAKAVGLGVTVSATAAFGPGGAIAAQAAMKLASKAAAGNPRAKEAVRRIAIKAKHGDPKARGLVAAMRSAPTRTTIPGRTIAPPTKIKKFVTPSGTVKIVVDVSGWEDFKKMLWTSPYRAHADVKSSARDMYRQGMLSSLPQPVALRNLLGV